MSTPVFQIGSTAPVTVFRRQQTQVAYNLYNTSPVATGPAVYLDDSPQAPGTTSGVPLYPGAQLSWEAGRECYAICPAGTAGQLTASPNAGSYFDPFSLATNLLTLAPGGSTLAQQIATSIYQQGVPAVDVPVIVYQEPGLFIPNNTSSSSPIIDVSRYSTLHLQAIEAGPVGTALARLYTIAWFADSGGSLLLGNDYLSVAAQAGVCRAQIPVRGPFAFITYGAVNPGADSTVIVTLAGSTVSKPLRALLTNGITEHFAPLITVPGRGFTVYQGTVNTGVTAQFYPDLYTGRVVVNVRANPITVNPCEFNIREAGTGARLYTTYLPVSASSQTRDVELYVPPITVEMTFVCSSTTNVPITVGLGQAGYQPQT